MNPSLALSAGSPPAQPPPRRRPPWWRRPFAVAEAPGARWFDVLFGAALPVVCLAYDPAVFRGGPMFGPPWLGHWAVWAWGSYCLAACALLVRVLAPPRQASGQALLAGALLAGALAALLTGIVMLPLTLFGMLFAIGFLGLVPFVTARVYWRNAVQAWRSAQRGQPSRRRALWLAAAGFGCVVLAPGAGQAIARHGSVEGQLQAALAGAEDELVLAGAVDVEWQRLFVFGPYTPGDFVDEALGFHWQDHARDLLAGNEGHSLVVFATPTRVTGHAFLRRGDADFCRERLGPLSPASARFRVRRMGGTAHLCPVSMAVDQGTDAP